MVLRGPLSPSSLPRPVFRTTETYLSPTLRPGSVPIQGSVQVGHCTEERKPTIEVIEIDREWKGDSEQNICQQISCRDEPTPNYMGFIMR